MRIGIVNDSTMAVEALRRVTTSVPGHSIAWIARNGTDGVAEAARDKPDCILMDLHMPGMDGVEATRLIMTNNPCPILIVTATVDGHAALVFEALAAGALDAVGTPIVSGPGETESSGKFLAKLRTIERLTGKRVRNSQPSAYTPTPRPFSKSEGKGMLIVIGASAGGPGAIAEVLKSLHPPFPPIVVVQHIDPQFAGGMADWLDTQTSLDVRLARSNDIPVASHVYVAGLEGHLVYTESKTLDYSAEPKNSAYMPCIDAFFTSVADNWKGRIAATLLTGMGRDGAEGLKLLRDSGAYTIAQDKRSSVVYGMPKAALELNAAAEILPLNRIAAALMSFQERAGRNV